MEKVPRAPWLPAAIPNQQNPLGGTFVGDSVEIYTDSANVGPLNCLVFFDLFCIFDRKNNHLFFRSMFLWLSKHRILVASEIIHIIMKLDSGCHRLLE